MDNAVPATGQDFVDQFRQGFVPVMQGAQQHGQVQAGQAFDLSVLDQPARDVCRGGAKQVG